VTDLRERWPLPDRDDLRDDLLAAYADPGRGYHDTLHLTEVLDRLDELAAAGEEFDRERVALAAWFHDAVYDGEPGAEERSARWAEQTISDPEVARLVRMTEHHRPEPTDVNGCALSDADLAILAVGPERYAAYVSAVRREYAHVSDEDFAVGRGLVLRDLLAKPALFQTRHGHEAWEALARANLLAELAL
jgi:predicted metal-dependent HD superfamily phosphohydrolase